MANPNESFFKRYAVAIYLVMALLGIFLAISPKIFLAPGETKDLYKDITVGLGVNILSVSIVFLLIERFFQFNILSKERQQLQGAVNNLKKLSLVISGGSTIIKVYNNYPVDVVRVKMQEAKSEILIAGTWPKSTEPLPNTIIEPLKNKVRIKVVFLTPESVAARARLLSLFPTSSDAERKKRISVAISSLRQFINKLPASESLTVKLSPIGLPFRLIVCDSWILIGFYWFGRTSAEGTHIEFDKTSNPKLFEEISEDFDYIFSDSNAKSLT